MRFVLEEMPCTTVVTAGLETWMSGTELLLQAAVVMEWLWARCPWGGRRKRMCCPAC